MEKNDDIMRNQQPPQNPLLRQQEKEQLQNFWYHQMEAVGDFKTHQLPLARIKKIMKSDRDVRMISAEAPIVFAKACEMFIIDLTMRSWLHAEENKRRTLQKSDISTAVARTFAFDFLLDVVPRDDSLAADPSFMAMPQPDCGLPYYLPPGVVTGNPVVGGNGMYAPPTPGWPSAWPAVNDDGEDEAGHSGGPK